MTNSPDIGANIAALDRSSERSADLGTITSERQDRVGPALTYLICASTRSGSTLLADGLAQTGRAGLPDEYFDPRPEFVAYRLKQFGAYSDADYSKVLAERTMTPNGVFGVKLHWLQHEAMRRSLMLSNNVDVSVSDHLSLHDLLCSRYCEPKYLWLLRRNKVAQAISHYRASRTGVWRAGQTPVSDSVASVADLAFRFDDIRHLVNVAHESDRQWDVYFRENNIKPMVVIYEDFIGAYSATLIKVLRFLGINLQGLNIRAPRVKRQGDNVSIEWERRYLSIEKRRALARISITPYHCSRNEDFPQAEEDQTTGQIKGAETIVNNPLFVGYRIDSASEVKIAAASARRSWMDSARHTYRCLPMVMANQAGWFLLNPEAIIVSWDGEDGLESLTVKPVKGGVAKMAHSHFGQGILTFSVPYLFRTSPKFSLYVRGPANSPKDGIQALEGIIESDWIESTFTMNWKMTRPNYPVVFEEDEPIAMIAPLKINDLEHFKPQIQYLNTNPGLLKNFNAWKESRIKFNNDLSIKNTEAQKEGWQRHYLRGLSVASNVSHNNKTKLNIFDFEDFT